MTECTYPQSPLAWAEVEVQAPLKPVHDEAAVSGHVTQTGELLGDEVHPALLGILGVPGQLLNNTNT